MEEKKANTEPYIIYKRSENCPRKILINHEHSFVILNNHGGMPSFDKSGAQQQKIRYIWDCRSGKFWLKKTFASEKQHDAICYLIYGPDKGESSLGLPKMFMSENESKFRYFEEMANFTLPKFLVQKERNLDISELVALMDALRKIHSVLYQPASFFSIDKSYSSNYNLSHVLFHGDISPNNILYEKSIGLMLTDFHSLGDLNNLYWTRGWASPECIQFAMTGTKYQDMTTKEFLAKYGAKKDTWAMGLIIGSLYRGRLAPPRRNPLPFFSFIIDKLKFDKTGQTVVDESGIADITQEEIDSKLDEMIKNEPEQLLKALLNCVKRYLTVDPDNRPTMDLVYLESI